MSGVPAGYHSVTPYLLAEDVEQLIGFLAAAFGAVETERLPGEHGGIGHAEVRIGDSIVMMSEASERHPAMPTMLYLYLPDVDAAYAAALGSGAVSITEPADQFYGDRVGAVRDPSGNEWWIAARHEDVAPDELIRRANERQASGS